MIMQSIPSDFWSWFSKFSSDDLAGLVAGLFVVSAVAVGMICLTLYMIHKNRTEDALNRDLLDRGLSADEIATIINAKADKRPMRRSNSR
jgi:hypothetical protein